MKSKIPMLFVPLMLACGMQDLHAFYHPSMGRWLSRDPIGEGGAYNLSSFVGNNAVQRTDMLGLAFGCSPPTCFGKKYNSSQECCKPGVGIVSRAEVGTGVFHCNFAPPPGTPDFMGHQWVEFPGGSAGYNYLFLHSWANPDVLGGSTGPGTTREEIKLSPCRYDLSQFVLLVQLYTSVDIGTKPGTYDCGSYVDEIVGNSETGSKYDPSY